MPSPVDPRDMVRQFEDRLGRRLTDEELRRVLEATGEVADSPPPSPGSRLRSAGWTVLEFLAAMWIFVLWGLIALLVWAWPSISSFVSSMAERHPLAVLAIAAAPFTSLLVAFVFGMAGGGGGRRASGAMWVVRGTRTKARDATVREAYEHDHGPGSWERRAAMLGRVEWLLGLLAAGLGPLLLADWFEPALAAFGPGADPLRSAVAGMCGALVFVILTLVLDGMEAGAERSGSGLVSTGSAVEHPLAALVAIVMSLAAAVAGLLAAGFITVGALLGGQPGRSGLGRGALGVYLALLVFGGIFGLIRLLLRRGT